MEEGKMHKVSQELITEYRNEIAKHVQLKKAAVDGQLWMLNAAQPGEQNRDHSAIQWILRCHAGTLDKLGSLFTYEGEYRLFELCAIARNLFENLVWLRLMNENAEYGIVFFHQLLKEQTQHNKAMLQKMMDEAALFEESQAEDTEILMTTIGALQENASPEEIKAAQHEHKEKLASLDARIRQEFCLHARSVVENGYSYQSYVIKEETVPKLQERQEVVADHQNKLNAVLPTLLSPKFQQIVKDKWNWFQRAAEVGMEKHYKFIYSYTSKMLHSTALNIITDKTLAAEEEEVVLEYILVAARDLITQIEKFSYPGQVRVLAI